MGARFRNFRYQCKKDGFFLLPWDCTRYITCSGGNGHICSCPFGQGFDPKLKVCNWVENVKGWKLASHVNRIIRNYSKRAIVRFPVIYVIKDGFDFLKMIYFFFFVVTAIGRNEEYSWFRSYYFSGVFF